MFVATLNYELFQRTDVLYAAESTDALRPVLKDSAKRGLEPFEWLKSLFEKLPDWKANRLEEFLP